MTPFKIKESALADSQAKARSSEEQVRYIQIKKLLNCKSRCISRNPNTTEASTPSPPKAGSSRSSTPSRPSRCEAAREWAERVDSHSFPNLAWVDSHRYPNVGGSSSRRWATRYKCSNGTWKYREDSGDWLACGVCYEWVDGWFADNDWPCSSRGPGTCSFCL